jgi:circadian clock protein KaiB
MNTNSSCPDIQDKDIVIRLYIAGATPHSQTAVKNITRLCDKYCTGKYELEIIDIYQQPNLAKSEHIIAAPTLIRYAPEPARRLIGDLSDTSKVLSVLGVTED